MTLHAADEPLVSVGFASYNRPSGAHAALTAITSQTYRNLDIIISDNASTDDRTREVIRGFKVADSRIRLFEQPQNIGQVANFEFLYHQAIGELFVWAADDDAWHPRFIETCVDGLKRHPTAVLSFCHVRKYDPLTLHTLVADHDDGVSDLSESRTARMATYLRKSASNECFYGVYRKSAITPWFFRRAYGNDHIALLSLLKHGAIVSSPHVLFSSGVAGLGTSRTNYSRYYDRPLMKMLVTLNSTLVWFGEFQHYVWTDSGLTVRERLTLSRLVIRRFLQYRFLRRFAGDVLALIRNPWLPVTALQSK